MRRDSSARSGSRFVQHQTWPFLLAASLAPATPLAAQWSTVPPPTGGEVTFVETSPHQIGQVFVGHARGLQRSTNAGRSWSSPLAGTEDSLSAPVAFHPNDPLVMLAASVSGAVLRSLDGGSTWSEQSLGSSIQIPSIVFNPSQAGQAFLIARYGVSSTVTLRRSDDAGDHWTSVSSVAGSAADRLLVSPVTGDLFLYGPTGLRQSTDGGVSFQTPIQQEIYDFAVTPSQPNGMWALGSNALWLSTDAGMNWVSSSLPSQSGDLRSLIVREDDSRRVVVGSIYGPLWESRDAGALWSRVGDLPARVGVGDLESASWNANLLLAASSNGCGTWLSLNGGRTWKEANVGLEALIDRLIVHSDPTVPIRVLSGGGLYETQNAGSSWQLVDVPGASGVVWEDAAISPVRPNTLLLSDASRGTARLFLTDDGGTQWRFLDPPLPETANEVAIGPTGLLFAHARNNLARSSDSGANWTVTVSPFALEILPDPRLEFLLHLAASQGEYRSIDAGLTWVRSLGASPDDIAIHPSDSRRVFAAGHQHAPIGSFFVSRNGGETFQASGSGLPMQSLRACVAVDEREPDRIFVSTNNFVWLSDDAGESFVRLENGNHRQNIQEIAVLPGGANQLWVRDGFGDLTRYDY